MLLISSGCSFSENNHQGTWPNYLSKKLSCSHHPLASGSQGNGLIMRKLIHHLETKKLNDENILVGVMWSGPNRSDFFVSDISGLETLTTDHVPQNPTFLDKNHPGGWVILNHHWKDYYSKNYYGNFYDPVYSTIQTMEYILHTQWYLERKNIPYFMMCYTGYVLDLIDLNHPEVNYLYKQIDFSKFSDTKGCYEWCLKNTGISFPENDNHPTYEQHSMYVEGVILPHLRERNLI